MILRFYDSSLRVEFILYVPCRVKKAFLTILRGSALSQPTCVNLRDGIRWWLDFFFLYPFFSFLHQPKVKKCSNLLYYLNSDSHSFYCSIFALNYFYDSFQFHSLSFYFYIRFCHLFFNWYLFCFSSFF